MPHLINPVAHKRTCRQNKGRLKNLIRTLSLSNHVTASGPSAFTTHGVQIHELPEFSETLETENEGDIGLDELEQVSICREFFSQL